MSEYRRKCADGVSLCSREWCECHVRLVKLCIVCGKPRSRRAQAYCSQPCSQADRHGADERLEKWLAGETSADGASGRNHMGLAGWARRYLLEEAGWACTKCGWNTPHPKSGRPPLEVDHIDGDRRNNYRSNMQVLCPNCHALKPDNKGMNRNKYSGKVI